MCAPLLNAISVQVVARHLRYYRSRYAPLLYLSLFPSPNFALRFWLKMIRRITLAAKIKRTQQLVGIRKK